MSDSTTIYFAPWDHEDVERMALERMQPKRAAGVTDYRVDQSRDAIEIDEDGIYGELVVTRLRGQPLQHWPRELGGDDGADLQDCGVRIQVKASRATRPRLMFPAARLERFRAAAAVLVRLDARPQPRYGKVVGWIPRRAFLAKAKRGEFGYGPTVYLPHGDLWAFEAYEPWLEGMVSGT